VDTLQFIKSVLTDPANRAVILYSLAATFLLIALIFALAGHRKKIIAKNHSVVIEGNSSGPVITGEVGGDVDASVSTPRNRSAAKEPSSMGLLPLLAALSGIVSAIFAALAYFLPPVGP
jgi:hypothetical protein